MSHFLTQEDGQNLYISRIKICRADMQILGESAPLPSSRGDLSSLEHDTGYYGEKRKPGQGRVWVLITGSRAQEESELQKEGG